MNRTIVLTLCILTCAAFLAGCTTSPEGPITSLRVDFGGERPDVAFDLPFDPDARPADAHYKRSGAPHTAYTAYDQLVQWADATKTSLDIQPTSWGDCLGRIAGVPSIGSCGSNATAYWSLNVNGADAMEGMATYVLKAGDRVTWTLTPITKPGGDEGTGEPEQPGSPVPDPAPAARVPLELSAPGVVETTDGRVEFSGTATAAARLSVAVGANVPLDDEGTLQRDGNDWMLRLELPAAAVSATVTFTADDGLESKSAQTRIIRLGHAVFHVDYKGVKAERDDTVWYDWTNHTSAPAYADRDVAHPDYYTVHDFMAAWSQQTGAPIVMSYYDGVGYFVNSIDGVGTPGTVGDTTGAGPWCYNLNGESAELGISQQELKAGDVVEWVLGCA